MLRDIKYTESPQLLVPLIYASYHIVCNVIWFAQLHTAQCTVYCERIDCKDNLFETIDKINGTFIGGKHYWLSQTKALFHPVSMKLIS